MKWITDDWEALRFFFFECSNLDAPASVAHQCVEDFVSRNGITSMDGIPNERDPPNTEFD